MPIKASRQIKCDIVIQVTVNAPFYGKAWFVFELGLIWGVHTANGNPLLPQFEPMLRGGFPSIFHDWATPCVT